MCKDVRMLVYLSMYIPRIVQTTKMVVFDKVKCISVFIYACLKVVYFNFENLFDTSDSIFVLNLQKMIFYKHHISICFPDELLKYGH